MKHTREQKRAALLAQAQALIEEVLDWEAQAERPNLTQIEDVAWDLRARFGCELAESAVSDQEAQQPLWRPRVRPVALSCATKAGRNWTSRAG